MIGSIERGWRRTTRYSLVPVVMLIGIHGPIDQTRRSTGYGGVLPVPAPTATGNATSNRSEPLLDQQRRGPRAARGRVLYADGHTSPSASVRPEHPEHGVTCPERRIVQRGRASSSPTS